MENKKEMDREVKRPEMSYIADLCKESNEIFGFTIGDIHTSLEEKGWGLVLHPDFWKTGMFWNWQILVFDPSDPDYISGKYSTGMYGDKYDFPKRQDALVCGTCRMLELYLLSLKPLPEKLKNDIREKYGWNMEGYNLLDSLVLISEKKHLYGIPAIDSEWAEFKRKTAEEYLEYIERRIRECLDLG